MAGASATEGPGAVASAANATQAISCSHFKHPQYSQPTQLRDDQSATWVCFLIHACTPVGKHTPSQDLRPPGRCSLVGDSSRWYRDVPHKACEAAKSSYWAGV